MRPRLARRVVPYLLAVALMPAAARADHAFILPSATSYSGAGNMATFDAAGSDHVFFFDHRPIQLGSIKVWQPDGTAGMPLNATRMRFRSVFDLRLDLPGTWKVTSEQVMVSGSLRLNGEERRVGGRSGGGGAGGERREDGGRPDDRVGLQPVGRRPDLDRGSGGTPAGAGERRQPPIALADIPADATDLHLAEAVNRTETFVTVDRPTTAVFKLTGQGLELEPITHPNTLAAGETARFRFLVDGRPAPGLKVTVIAGGDRYRDDPGTVTLATGADGTVAVRWPAAGLYWLGAEAEDHHPAEPRAELRRMTYSATLEVMTP